MIDAQTSGRLFSALGDAAARIGADDFYPTLLDAMKTLVPTKLSVVARYSRFSPTDLTFVEGSPKDVVRLFQSEYYDIDPFYLWWCSSGTPGVVTLAESVPHGFNAYPYVTMFLKQAGISDEVGVFFPPVGGDAMALFLERRKGTYSDEDVARLRMVYPALKGLFRAHIKHVYERIEQSEALIRPTAFVDQSGNLVMTSATWKEMLTPDIQSIAKTIRKPGRTIIDAGRQIVAERVAPDFPIAPRGLMLVLSEQGRRPIPAASDPETPLSADFTDRENDVVGLILRGYDNRTIARELGLSYGTVKNYRSSIYQKLAISTERELFIHYIELQRGKA